jgi:hypothetical protein
MKKMLLALVMMASVGASAATTINTVLSSVNETVMGQIALNSPFNWVVGDTAV